jgi:putative radical SAM enzyme (TIGR03279 family)
MRRPPCNAAESAAPTAPGGLIAGVQPKSVAQRAGLRAGDWLLTINGRPLRDVIDAQFFGAEESLEFTFRRGDQIMRRRVRRGYADDLGIEFASLLFDGLRECGNHCPFCFVRQAPPGLRDTLYVYDDDYRFSFLHAGFVTLTNLTEADWERLAEQRLSPMYVSVHATEPALRERMLGRRGLTPILEQLRRLIALGIEAHTQIVVTPEWNDGPALIQSVEDLAALYPGVLSIGLVPVGLTRYQRGRLRRPTLIEATQVIEQTAAWQAGFRRRHDLGLVYAADEWHLLAGRPMPPAAYYDDFPQFENGIGLTRHLLDDWESRRAEVTRRAWDGRPIACVCGTLIAPVMGSLLDDLRARAGIEAELIAVPNRFFGEEVTVSGLLTAGDVVEALERRAGAWSRIFLPRSMFDAEGALTLDDWTVERLAATLGAPVTLAQTLDDILEGCVGGL